MSLANLGFGMSVSFLFDAQPAYAHPGVAREYASLRQGQDTLLRVRSPGSEIAGEAATPASFGVPRSRRAG